MFERDYLMRLFLALAQAIARSLSIAEKEKQPESAADFLDVAIGDAVGMDSDTLLSLSPDSITQIMQACGTDPGVTEYIARSMLLSGNYYEQAGKTELAALRKSQAEAVAKAYGHDLGDTNASSDEQAEKILDELENRGVNLD